MTQAISSVTSRPPSGNPRSGTPPSRKWPEPEPTRLTEGSRRCQTWEAQPRAARALGGGHTRAGDVGYRRVADGAEAW